MGEALITRRGGGEEKKEYGLIASGSINKVGGTLTLKLPKKLIQYSCLVFETSYSAVANETSLSWSSLNLSVGGSAVLKVGEIDVGGMKDVDGDGNTDIVPNSSGTTTRSVTVALINPTDRSAIQTSAWNGSTAGFQSTNNKYVTFETLDTDTIYLAFSDTSRLKSISSTTKVYGI